MAAQLLPQQRAGESRNHHQYRSQRVFAADQPVAGERYHQRQRRDQAGERHADHGLYTEHLLREMRVPEAKVEDVFKRVRLGVRRRSRGLQIPWESTSLEEDFWFIPPAAVIRLEREQEEREFRQELALWETTRRADQPEPLEAYLRQYPNGRFAELAQLRLD